MVKLLLWTYFNVKPRHSRTGVPGDWARFSNFVKEHKHNQTTLREEVMLQNVFGFEQVRVERNPRGRKVVHFHFNVEEINYLVQNAFFMSTCHSTIYWDMSKMYLLFS